MRKQQFKYIVEVALGSFGLNWVMIPHVSAGKFKVNVANGVITLSWTERKDRFDQTYSQLWHIVNNSETTIDRFLHLIGEI